jgi:hypothetical protein
LRIEDRGWRIEFEAILHSLSSILSLLLRVLRVSAVNQ